MCSPVDLILCSSVILVHEIPYDVCVAIGGRCNHFDDILMYSTRMHATITVLNMESAEALGNYGVLLGTAVQSQLDPATGAKSSRRPELVLRFFRL